MSDYIVRATAADANIRAFAVTSREMVETAREDHMTTPVMTAALGRLLSAGAMMGAMMKGDKDIITLQIQCSGPAKGLTVTADSHGNVKGFAINPQVELPLNAAGKLDVGGALDLGILTVIKDITFITTSELEEMFPDNTPKEREYYFAKAKGAICVMQIGDKLANGEPHDGRAPDYDDWALNADIIVYYPVLDIALELSSMGIRVDEKALKEQLDKAGCPERAKLPFQKAILNKELPYTIGGGIGQSRICMFFLRKAHIGEVQSSLWPDETIKECEEHGIQLL
jgi:hypothetical protein